jgi:hypothetical protein
MFPIDVWIFPFFFLSVVEAFAYNGTGDETALKRLEPSLLVFQRALFSVFFSCRLLFLFCLASLAFKHRL